MRQTVPAPTLGAAHENVSFTTSDGLELQGWYVPSKNGAAVIAFPGRSGPRAHTRMLARHGYGVLLFDRRGEGQSEGDSNLLGWGADKDILAAVEFLQGRPDVDPDRIGGIGLSVGGELMLQAAAETDELAAVVSEGAGTRQFSEQMEEFHGYERVLNAPGFLFVTAGTAVFSSTAPPPNLTDVAPKIKQPLFVIWAPNGGNIEHMSKQYYELAEQPLEADLGDADRQARRRHPRPAEGVRAPRRRLLRRRAPRRLATDPERPKPRPLQRRGRGFIRSGAGGGTRTHGLPLTNAVALPAELLRLDRNRRETRCPIGHGPADGSGTLGMEHPKRLATEHSPSCCLACRLRACPFGENTRTTCDRRRSSRAVSARPALRGRDRLRCSSYATIDRARPATTR